MSNLVIYTDGACKQNPGPTGYGIHMYKAGKNKTKQILSKYVATEIGYLPKTVFKKSNSGVSQTSVDFIVDIYGYENDSNTNNRAELDAVIKALEYVKLNLKNNDNFSDIDEIVLNIDSTYVLNTIEKILETDIDIKDINANPDKIKILKELLDSLKGIVKITTRKVAGHSGDLGNDRADLLANLGVILRYRDDVEQKIVITNRETYWDMETERPYFMENKLLFGYLNIDDKNTVNMISYLGLNYKEIDEIGKRDNEIIYQEYLTKEPNNYIKTITDLLITVSDGLVVPFVLKLDNIFNKQINRNIKLYGKDYLIPDNRVKMTVRTVDDIELATNVYPPSLSYRANEIFVELDNILVDYINKDKKINTEYKDITDLFYETNDKNKTVLKKDITKDKVVMDVDYNGVKIQIMIGLDTPKRNTMKKLEKLNPKVTLVILEDDYTYQYFTITEIGNEDKEYLITSNYYSSVKVKKRK